MLPADNLLIRQLPRTARKHLLDQCEPFEMQLSADLSVRGQPLSHAHFPIDGFVSLVIDVDQYPALEVGMVGREAMLGAELGLPVTHLDNHASYIEHWLKLLKDDDLLAQDKQLRVRAGRKAADATTFDRLAGAYPWRSVLKAGGRLAFGSDSPVEPADLGEIMVAVE